MSKHAEIAPTECIEACNHPPNYQLHSEEVEQGDLDGDDVDPELPWVGKFTGNANPIDDNNSAPNETQPIDADAKDKPMLVSAKRRLRRRKSELSKKFSARAPRNASPTDLAKKEWPY